MALILGHSTRRACGRWKSTAALAMALAAACAPGGAGMQMEAPMFTLDSPAFAAGAAIPARHTCDGDDVSPPLRWSGAPAGTRAFVLIVDDPDAPDPANPQRTWVHWVLYDLPATVDSLPEGVDAASLPVGAREGRNDWKRTGYGGPCPPIGRHRYFHKLYALDSGLPDLVRPDKATLLKAMEGHVLGQAELVGTYQR